MDMDDGMGKGMAVVECRWQDHHQDKGDLRWKVGRNIEANMSIKQRLWSEGTRAERNIVLIMMYERKAIE